jgi:hypothetical protein
MGAGGLSYIGSTQKLVESSPFFLIIFGRCLNIFIPFLIQKEQIPLIRIRS